MIKTFVNVWNERNHELLQKYSEEHPSSYSTIVNDVIKLLHEHLVDGEIPDPTRITAINHGDYQGTILFVIGSTEYQTSTFWYSMVAYGSCSGCDTLQGIRGYEDNVVPTPSQAKQYWTLALHILQSIKPLGGERE